MEFQEQIIESQKKLLITLSFFVIALEGFAQSRGYEGNVYLGGVSCFNENFGTGVEFATTHGVATADGVLRHFWCS